MDEWFKVLGIPRRADGQTHDQYAAVVNKTKAMGKNADLARAVLADKDMYEMYLQIHCTKTLYDVLGVGSTASASEISLAYKKLSVRAHPDRCNGSVLLKEQATANQSRVNVAFATLRDHRHAYDRKKSYDFFSEVNEDDSVDTDESDDLFGSSQCEESDGEESDCYNSYDDESKDEARRAKSKAKPKPKSPPKPKQQRAPPKPKQQRAPRKPKQQRKPAPNSKSARSAKPKAPAREKENTDREIVMVVMITFAELFRGCQKTIQVESRLFDKDKGIHVTRPCQMDLVIPPRIKPGLFVVLPGVGQYSETWQKCLDVHVYIDVMQVNVDFKIVDDVLWARVVVPLKNAVTGRGSIAFLDPNGQEKTLLLTQPVHDEQVMSLPMEGLWDPDTQLTGPLQCILKIQYPVLTETEKDLFEQAMGKFEPDAKRMQTKLF